MAIAIDTVGLAKVKAKLAEDKAALAANKSAPKRK
jgi:hypothetical protein